MDSTAIVPEPQKLITIHSRTLQGKPTECVNARDLHGYLDVGRDFSTWIKARVEQYGFEHSLDYLTISRSPERGSSANEFSPERGKTSNSGGRPTVDYFISLDMAKELAMVERNEKGREARRYFIECEKRLKEKLKQEAQPQIPTRYMVEVQDGQMGTMKPIPDDWFLMSMESLPGFLADRLFVDEKDLVAISKVCMDRLSKKMLA